MPAVAPVERRGRELAEAIPLIAWIVRADGSMHYANRRWCEYAGGTARELAASAWYSVLHPEDRDQVREQWDRAVRAGLDFDAQIRLRRKDGTYHWHLARAAPLEEKPDRISLGIVTCTEIDGLWQSRDALRASEARLHLAVKNTMMAVSHQDLDLRYTWIYNPQGNNSDQTMVGRRDEDLLPAADAQRLTEIKRRVLESSVGERTEVRLTLSGRARYYDAIFEPWRDSHGRIDGVGVAALEVTERRQSEEAKHAGERVFRAIFEEASDAIVLADDSGRFITANAVADRVLGVSPGGLIGRSIGEFTGPGLDFLAAWQDFLRRGRVEGQIHLYCDDGKIRLVEYNFRASILPGRHISFMRDVTERQREDDARGRYVARLNVLQSLNRAILAASSPDEVAESVLLHLARLLPYDAGSIVLCDAEGRPSRVLASGKAKAQGETAIEIVSLSPAITKPDESEPECMIGCCEDVSAMDFAQLPATGGMPESLRAKGCQAYLAAPMMCEGRKIGVLGLCTTEQSEYSPEHVEIANEVADILAIAVKQSVMFEEVRSTHEQLQTLSRRLIRAEEDERRRIARELHDETGQALTAIKLNLRSALRDLAAPSAALRLEESLGLVERTIQQVGGISLDLRPSLLDDLGLVPALRSYSQRLSERLGIDVGFQADATIGRLEPEVETVCYRIAQEALHNVAKHARASRVRIQLSRSDRELRLIVGDDGIGCDVEAVTNRATRGQSVGVLSMAERASLIGGQVLIQSVPGFGTTVTAIFPSKS